MTKDSVPPPPFPPPSQRPQLSDAELVKVLTEKLRQSREKGNRRAAQLRQLNKTLQVRAHLREQLHRSYENLSEDLARLKHEITQERIMRRRAENELYAMRLAQQQPGNA